MIDLIRGLLWAQVINPLESDQPANYVQLAVGRGSNDQLANYVQLANYGLESDQLANYVLGTKIGGLYNLSLAQKLADLITCLSRRNWRTAQPSRSWALSDHPVNCILRAETG